MKKCIKQHKGDKHMKTYQWVWKRMRYSKWNLNKKEKKHEFYFGFLLLNWNWKEFWKNFQSRPCLSVSLPTRVTTRLVCMKSFHTLIVIYWIQLFILRFYIHIEPYYINNEKRTNSLCWQFQINMLVFRIFFIHSRSVLKVCGWRYRLYPDFVTIFI